MRNRSFLIISVSAFFIISAFAGVIFLKEYREIVRSTKLEIVKVGDRLAHTVVFPLVSSNTQSIETTLSYEIANTKIEQILLWSADNTLILGKTKNLKGATSTITEQPNTYCDDCFSYTSQAYDSNTIVGSVEVVSSFKSLRPVLFKIGFTIFSVATLIYLQIIAVIVVIKQKISNEETLKKNNFLLAEYAAKLENKNTEIREEHKKLEDKQKELKNKNEELKQFNRLVVDRELTMVALKERIKELENKPKN